MVLCCRSKKLNIQLVSEGFALKSVVFTSDHKIVTLNEGLRQVLSLTCKL